VIDCSGSRPGFQIWTEVRNRHKLSVLAAGGVSRTTTPHSLLLFLLRKRKNIYNKFKNERLQASHVIDCYVSNPPPAHSARIGRDTHHSTYHPPLENTQAFVLCPSSLTSSPEYMADNAAVNTMRFFGHKKPSCINAHYLTQRCHDDSDTRFFKTLFEKYRFL